MYPLQITHVKLFLRFQPLRISFAKNNQTRRDDLELIYFNFYGFFKRSSKETNAV